MLKKKNRGGARIEPDARIEQSKKAVLAATYELLARSGLSGVSVDEVSRRSGVAKTTIYRHWPSRESLLLDACSQLSPRPQAPDTGKLATDLEMLAKGAAIRLHQPWATVLPSIIDAGERDKELANLQSQIHAQIRGPFIAVIERGRERGELPRAENAAELAASILGPLLYRRFFSREPLDEAFAKKVIERALRRSA